MMADGSEIASCDPFRSTLLFERQLNECIHEAETLLSQQHKYIISIDTES